MENPVICEDGITYEKSAIMKWLSENKTSPITRKVISSDKIYPNIGIKKLIEEYKRIEECQRLEQERLEYERLEKNNIFKMEQYFVISLQPDIIKDIFNYSLLSCKVELYGSWNDWTMGQWDTLL